MTILKNVVITTKYTGRDGKERKRYTIVGHLHSGEYGEYLTLNAEMNLAAFPRKEGDNRITANLYDPKPKDEEAPKTAAREPDFEDSQIPF